MGLSDILEVLRHRVLVFDGAMGTTIQRRELSLADYDGHENCVDVVTLTRPDVVLDIHRAYLAVGCDAVSTNTFGANKIVLAEFGIAHKTYEINKRAAELARQAVDEFTRPRGTPPFVLPPWSPSAPLGKGGGEAEARSQKSEDRNEGAERSPLSIGNRQSAIGNQVTDRSLTVAARKEGTDANRHPRWVVGSCGPGTKLPSLGQTTWDELVDSYAEQVRGLLDGGVDAVLIETVQDILQAKAAIVAATDAMQEKGREVPIVVTVTIETTGTMLLGTDIAAALTALQAYDQVAAIGLNCATGPQEMSEHVRFLSKHCDRPIIVQPNAGLPQLVDGKPYYALTPKEFARWLTEFVEVDGVSIVGGCCGTTPEHLAAVVDAIGDRAPKEIGIQRDEGTLDAKRQGQAPAQRHGEKVEKSKSQKDQTRRSDEGNRAATVRERFPDRRQHREKQQHDADSIGNRQSAIGNPATDRSLTVAARKEEAPSGSRVVQFEPAVSSLYQSVAIRQENAVLAIGERTNANGSKKFRELLAAGDLDGMVGMAREQVKHGSHLLDVCTAYVGRDETVDMTAVLKRLVTDVTAPLVIDSTEVPVIEAALKIAGGKCVINSINLEDGEERLDKVCRLAKRHGAAVIALTIDEQGMAKTCDRKVEVARRIHDLVVNRHRIQPGDLIFDPLTFTICTGNEDDRRLGLETLDAIGRIKDELPGVHTVLGLSNISFGVKPQVRRVLNSVFLHHARERGLDAAIMHVTGIVPLYKIDDEQRRLAEDLIYDRRREGYDPLALLLKAFPDEAPAEEGEKKVPRKVEDRLKARIINGDRVGLEEDLDEAMLTYRPLDIVNDVLLDGMKTVGDLFAAGQMQLPFVLQSAETMKAAVKHLEPYMDKSDQSGKGSIVLATVRGDVHDIGKNLVDIILTNNGYTVHNLGIKQPINSIIEAAEKSQADAIGMSGLLVKSTVVMRENLGVLNERGIEVPVILGGAALTRKYVEQDLRPEYEGPLFYAKDAFDGLRLMDAVVSGEAGKPAPVSIPRVGDSRLSVPCGAGAQTEPPLIPPYEGGRPELIPPYQGGIEGGDSTAAIHERAAERHGYLPPVSDISREEPIPPPPFWGSRVVAHIDPKAALAYLNENMLFQVQWGYRKNRRSPEDFKKYIGGEVRPVLRRLLEVCERESILQPQAIYGFWPSQSDGDVLNIHDPHDREKKPARFEFPRMGKPPYWCLSDFVRPMSSGEFDVTAFMVVTVGRQVSEVAREWFKADRYQDYLHLHGLGVELAEALAEYIHKQIRMEWGIAGNDAREKQEIFKQRYQGSRYSFGYPACPRLEDQLKLWPLLKPERIGVTLSEEFQLEPEQSTTALIVHHRQAKYFNVR